MFNKNTIPTILTILVLLLCLFYVIAITTIVTMTGSWEIVAGSWNLRVDKQFIFFCDALHEYWSTYFRNITKETNEKFTIFSQKLWLSTVSPILVAILLIILKKMLGAKMTKPKWQTMDADMR